jgi:hypothetical protein
MRVVKQTEKSPKDKPAKTISGRILENISEELDDCFLKNIPSGKLKIKKAMIQVFLK